MARNRIDLNVNLDRSLYQIFHLLSGYYHFILVDQGPTHSKSRNINIEKFTHQPSALRPLFFFEFER